MKIKTVKIKTGELSGAALDWAVAKVLKLNAFVNFDKEVVLPYENIDDDTDYVYSPSDNWSQCGPLIYKYRIYVRPRSDWSVASIQHLPKGKEVDGFYKEGYHLYADGPTPQVAICRVVVASELGSEVDVPEELYTKINQEKTNA